MGPPDAQGAFKRRNYLELTRLTIFNRSGRAARKHMVHRCNTQIKGISGTDAAQQQQRPLRHPIMHWTLCMLVVSALCLSQCNVATASDCKASKATRGFATEDCAQVGCSDEEVHLQCDGFELVDGIYGDGTCSADRGIAFLSCLSFSDLQKVDTERNDFVANFMPSCHADNMKPCLCLAQAENGRKRNGHMLESCHVHAFTLFLGAGSIAKNSTRSVLRAIHSPIGSCTDLHRASHWRPHLQGETDEGDDTNSRSQTHSRMRHRISLPMPRLRGLAATFGCSGACGGGVGSCSIMMQPHSTRGRHSCVETGETSEHFGNRATAMSKTIALMIHDALMMKWSRRPVDHLIFPPCLSPSIHPLSPFPI